MDFARNVGRNDKNIRIAAGIVLLIVALFFMKGFFSFLFTLIGAVLLSTGLISFCPLYNFLGKSTATAAETVSASDDLTERASENFDDFKEEAVETAQELKEKAEDIADDLKDKAEDWKDKAEDIADDLKDKAEDVAQDLKKEAGELMDDAKDKIDDVKKSAKKND